MTATANGRQAPSDTLSCTARVDTSAREALDAASCFLASALSVVSDFAHEADSHTAWTVAYLVEMSKAAVDAAASSIAGESRHG